MNEEELEEVSNSSGNTASTSTYVLQSKNISMEREIKIRITSATVIIDISI